MEQSQDNISEQTLRIIRQFLMDIEAERAIAGLTVHSSLERELGLGSLERSELFNRLERHFEIHLPDSLIGEAQITQDVIDAIREAKPPTQFLKTPRPESLETTTLDPSKAKTVTEVLQLYAKKTPQRPHLYLQDEYGEETCLRYGELYDNALKTAQGIVAMGISPGETLAIMLPTSLEFFYAFYGVLLAGCVPVPIYPPFRPDRIEEYAHREALILRNAGVRLLITFHRAERLSLLLKSFIPSLVGVVTIPALQENTCTFKPIPIEETDPALIQYTSGSTGDPKGVLLTHKNLLANIRAFGEGINIQPTDIGVSWLPLYHDMGLIGAAMGGLYFGIPLVLLSPLTFLTHPERWLWAIHYHRATLSAAPNFAYELCLKKIDPASLEGLDLSSWRLAFNGAEAIYPKTLERFSKFLAPYGFRKEALFPVYGLAESSVALTFPPPGRAPWIDRIARDPFETTLQAVPADPQEKHTHEFVSCGTALPGHEVRIVNDKDEPLAERCIGRLQFRGPSSMQGYYRKAEATAAIFHNGWWDTGDFGYMAKGELFITGRRKDLIIKAGRNYYPEEIEDIVSQVQEIRKGCIAAFGIGDPQKGTEKIIIVAETHPKTKRPKAEIISEIIDKVAVQLGIPPDHVSLVPPHNIPKTSSGKLRRSCLKQNYLAKKVGGGQVPVWWQITKLFLESTLKKCLKAIANTLKSFYTVYLGCLLLIGIPPLWLFVRFASKKAGAHVTHHWARMLLRFAGCPLKVIDQRSTHAVPVIYVTNHASYIDAVVLLAALPPNIAIIGKKELLGVPLLGSFIKKLEHLTVDRLDFSKSRDDTQHIKALLQEKRSIVLFPEGTFTYAAGVRPFKLGAFNLSVDTQLPISPIAIKGTRNILRATQKLLRPGRIEITFIQGITPTGTDWEAIIKLRNQARISIAKHCGEECVDLLDVRVPE